MVPYIMVPYCAREIEQAFPMLDAIEREPLPCNQIGGTGVHHDSTGPEAALGQQ
jgi:hypothetical protein